MWEGYKNYDHYFTMSQLTEFLDEISSIPIPIEGDRKEYINVPCSLDIETSSTYVDGKKFATMYLWGFGFNGSTIIGRTWAELKNLISQLSRGLELSSRRRLVCYIQNLGYEFQFIRKRFEWLKDSKGRSEVFAMKERRPVYANSKFVDFRCSYFLSNYSLAYIGSELLHKYPVEKAVGDLDYSLVRHSETPLTDKEIWYQVKDVQVVMSYIQEKIENEGGITNIPLTNTGYVRNFCREFCFTNGNPEADSQLKKKLSAEYHQVTKSLSIQTEREYEQLQLAFGGGFTHAAAKYSGLTINKVGSADESSAYPGAMVSDYFPMTRGIFIGDITLKKLQFYLQHYCCLFTVTMYNVVPHFIYENYISLSHCADISDDYTSNNGRVSSASYLTTTVTELDWDIITKTYSCDWDTVEIHGLRIYQRDYLPKSFILSILSLYGKKTELKGVEGKEVEYMVSKNMINSSYGMAVTAIVRDLITYEKSKWDTEKEDVRSQLIEYNKNYNRFLFYPWGVWVTAHARHNLWDAILEFGPDYVYADTDSIKGLNFDKHMDFFKKYNLNMKYKLMKMCLHYHIPFEMVKPKTIKGVEKMIGVWDMEEGYDTFRTIGAKRYIYEYEDGSLNITVAGVNKHFATPYLLYKYSNHNTDADLEFFKLAYSSNPNLRDASSANMKKLKEMRKSGELDYSQVFEHFTEGLYFPPEHTGKQTLTYIDKPTVATLVDYLGNSKLCYELSSIHMEPQDYSMSRTREYIEFLRGFQDASL